MGKYYVEKRAYFSEDVCNAIDELAYNANNTSDAFDVDTDRNDGFTFDIILPLRNISKREYERLIEIFYGFRKKTDKYETYAIFDDDYDDVLTDCENEQYVCVCYVVVRVFDDMDKKEIKDFKHHVNYNIINKSRRFIDCLDCFSNDN